MTRSIFDEYPFRKMLSIDYHWIKKDFPYQHDHDYWEFFFVTDEILEHHINGKVVLMKKGDGFLIKPSDVHYLKKHGNTVCAHATLLFRDQFVKEYCDSLQEGLYDIILNSDDLPLKLDTSQYKKLIEYLTLLQTNRAIDDRRAFISKLLAYYILEIVISRYFILTTKYPQWLNDLIFEINKPSNIGAFPRDILAFCNYSHTHILRMFKQYTNKTLIEYIIQVKMENASDFLLHSNMTTLEIANTLGYNSLSHFNHVFKKTFGLSPTQYKKTQK